MDPVTVHPFIEAEKRAGHSVKRACELLQVSRAAYYARRTGTPGPRAARDAELTEQITALHTRSRGTYGAPRVHAALMRDGAACGRRRVAPADACRRPGRRAPSTPAPDHRPGSEGRHPSRPHRPPLPARPHRTGRPLLRVRAQFSGRPADAARGDPRGPLRDQRQPGGAPVLELRGGPGDKRHGEPIERVPVWRRERPRGVQLIGSALVLLVPVSDVSAGEAPEDASRLGRGQGRAIPAASAAGCADTHAVAGRLP